MSKYEYYQDLKEKCETMAEKKKKDLNLFYFYKNAALGFSIKQKKLTLAEVKK